MELETYLEHIRLDAALLLAAVQRDPSAPVAACPDWNTLALLGHVGGVHHWVAHILETRTTERPARRFGPEARKGLAEYAPWYEEGVSELLAAFAATDPEAYLWNWSANEPAPARWWFRRMAQETTVHRWDAQAAVGAADAIDADLAADGIDEYLDFVDHDLRSGQIDGVDGFEGSLSLMPTDVAGAWHLHFAPDRLDRTNDDTTRATISGSASDLFLWLLHRASDDSGQLEVGGDPAVVSRWDAIEFD